MNKTIRSVASALLLFFMVSLFSGCAGTSGSSSQGAAGRTSAESRLTDSAASTAQTGMSSTSAPSSTSTDPKLSAISVKENGRYSSKLEVAAYLSQYGHLPDNYITKEDARDLGWVASKGNLWDVTDEMSIGGDSFGNFEGILPEKKGRRYYECDIDYQGGNRGAKRIVYSNDGLIFYTDDHYETFERLD